MPNAAPKHRVKTGTAKHSVSVEDTRGSSSARGYGAKWRKVRDAFMIWIAIKQAWPYACCVVCLAEGKRVRATDADHIKPRRLGGTDAFDNLQPLCHPHHSSKTAKEVGWTR